MCLLTRIHNHLGAGYYRLEKKRTLVRNVLNQILGISQMFLRIILQLGLPIYPVLL